MSRFLLSLLVLLPILNICSGLDCYHCDSKNAMDGCKKSQVSKTCGSSFSNCYTMSASGVNGTAINVVKKGCAKSVCLMGEFCPNANSCSLSCCSTSLCNGGKMLQQGILPVLSAVVVATLYVIF